MQTNMQFRIRPRVSKILLAIFYIALIGMLLHGFGLLFPPTRLDLSVLGQATQDSMALNVNQIATILNNPNLQPNAYLEACREVPHVVLVGGIAIMGTAGQLEQTTPLLTATTDAMTTLRNTLQTAVQRSLPDAAAGLCIRVLKALNQWIDMLGQVNGFTAATTPDSAIANPHVNPDLFDLDPSVRTGQLVIVDPLGFKFLRVVWSGFWPPVIFPDPEEHVIVTQPIPRGSCVEITKEKKGVVPVLVPIKVPIWVEPWFARRQIVGFAIIWVLWWIPAEFLKIITYCNTLVGTVFQVVATVNMLLILEWAQGHLWWFF